MISSILAPVICVAVAAQGPGIGGYLVKNVNIVDVADVAWTEADLALVDEADSLLGPPSAARPRSSASCSRCP